MNSVPKLILFLLLCLPAQAMDNAHFYRGSIFWGEPRLNRDWLTTIDCLVGGGSDCTSRNCEGNYTSLLNLYGLHNMHYLGRNVPNLDPNNPLDAILIQLNELPSNGTFGKLQFGGRFSMEEARIDVQQNFTHGLFTHLNLPIRHLRIKNITFVDKSPISGHGPNSNTPIWKEFLNNFNAILHRHNLCKSDSNTFGVGDFSWTVGWTNNNQKTVYLDYVDTTIQTGILFPTGKGVRERCVFELPTGYNKHWGLPINLDLSFGAWEWLTFGVNTGILKLFAREDTVHMKTSTMQNGFIKLAQGRATVYPGLVWHVGFYFKIDHITDRASFVFGYSHAQKNNDRLHPKNKKMFVTNIVNTDSMLSEWIVDTFHFVFEYDLAKEGRWYHPYVNFFINKPTGGKRSFDTTFGGVDAGLNLTWQTI